MSFYILNVQYYILYVIPYHIHSIFTILEPTSTFSTNQPLSFRLLFLRGIVLFPPPCIDAHTQITLRSTNRATSTIGSGGGEASCLQDLSAHSKCLWALSMGILFRPPDWRNIFWIFGILGTWY